MLYLQVKPAHRRAGDDPKTPSGVLKRCSIEEYGVRRTSRVTGKNLLAHKRTPADTTRLEAVRTWRRPEFWMPRFLFAATDHSPIATGFATMSRQGILP